MRHRFWQPDFPFAAARSPFFYGWTIALIGTIGAISTVPGQTMGVSVFSEPMMKTLGLGRMDLSLAYMLGTLASGLALPAGGRLLDAWGARKTMALATLAFGGALIFMGFSDVVFRSFRASVFHSLIAPGIAAILLLSPVYFMIRFFGQGLLMMASNNMRAKWFNRHRGIVMASGGVLISLTFARAPVTIGGGIEAFGWQSMWILLGLLMALLLAPLYWLFGRDNPEECGLVMDGKNALSDPSKNANPDTRIVRDLTRREALRTFPFWIISLILAWQGLFFTGYTFHIEDLGSTIGLPRTTILDLFIPISYIAIPTSLLLGWLVDRTRIKYFAVLMASSTALAALGLWLMPGELGKSLLVTGFGIAGGCFGVLGGNTYPRFFGRKHLGAITGISSSIMVLGTAFGPTLFSLSRSLAQDYRPAFLVGIAFPSGLALMAFFADNPQRRLAPSQ